MCMQILESELVGSGAASGKPLIDLIQNSPPVVPVWAGVVHCICALRDWTSTGFCTVLK